MIPNSQKYRKYYIIVRIWTGQGKLQIGFAGWRMKIRSPIGMYQAVLTCSLFINSGFVRFIHEKNHFLRCRQEIFFGDGVQTSLCHPASKGFDVPFAFESRLSTLVKTKTPDKSGIVKICGEGGITCGDHLMGEAEIFTMPFAALTYVFVFPPCSCKHGKASKQKRPINRAL